MFLSGNTILIGVLIVIGVIAIVFYNVKNLHNYTAKLAGKVADINERLFRVEMSPEEQKIQDNLSFLINQIDEPGSTEENQENDVEQGLPMDATVQLTDMLSSPKKQPPAPPVETTFEDTIAKFEEQAGVKQPTPPLSPVQSPVKAPPKKRPGRKKKQEPKVDEASVPEQTTVV